LKSDESCISTPKSEIANRISRFLPSILGIFFLTTTALPHETLTTTVLFDREIVRILNKHCVMCHFENGPSFPLETYEQTWLQGRKIRSEIIARHMPPWPAVPGYGQFANDNSLTLRETQFIISWVEGLGPRNSGTVFTNVVDSAGKPRAAVRATVDIGRWQLGQPSVTLPLETNTVEPGKETYVRRTVLDLGLKTPRRIRALEYMPGDRRVVRAATFTVQETGQWLGSWTPWHGVVELPSGAALELPAGAHIVSEIHYQRGSKPSVDRGTIGLFFADKPAPNTISDLVLQTRDLGTGNRFRGETKIAADTRLVALNLDISSGVKSVEVSARRPDGGTDVLLFAKDFPREWPTPFIFKQPIVFHRGTVLSVTAYGGSAKVTVSKY
jgi:hypothetical protein